MASIWPLYILGPYRDHSNFRQIRDNVSLSLSNSTDYKTFNFGPLNLIHF